MTCRFQPAPRPQRAQNAGLAEQIDTRRPLLPPPVHRPTSGSSSLRTQEMKKVEACAIIDNTIESLTRCMALVANPSSPAVSQSESKLLPHTELLPHTSDVTPEPNENSSILYEYFKDESVMPDIVRIIGKELSEPYSIYTYRYFVQNWPELCILAKDVENGCNVGVIVCKLEHDSKWRRGYIAMLAVEETYRRRGIGLELVRRAIIQMRLSGCDEVSLETEVANKKALALYDRLGFVRERRLFRYYLNGGDAFRLKLLFTQCWPTEVGTATSTADDNSSSQ